MKMLAAAPQDVRDPSLAYERLADSFAQAVSAYDTQRRVETLIDEFMMDIDLDRKQVLEVGTGLGHFARRLCSLGARVTATDIAPTLVERLRESLQCEALVVDALRLADHFPDGSFDIVLSSECIEHTLSPAAAVAQMVKVLRPGGYLALSTPNLMWQPVVRLASTFGLRPFDGLENFSSWRGLSALLAEHDMEIQQAVGLHLFPFQFKLHRLSRWCDRHLQVLRGFMINICILAKKPKL